MIGSMGNYSETRRGTKGGRKKRPACKPAGDALPAVGSGASHQPSDSTCPPAAQFRSSPCKNSWRQTVWEKWMEKNQALDADNDTQHY
jgi:hypothetical protein